MHAPRCFQLGTVLRWSKRVDIFPGSCRCRFGLSALFSLQDRQALKSSHQPITRPQPRRTIQIAFTPPPRPRSTQAQPGREGKQFSRPRVTSDQTSRMRGRSNESKVNVASRAGLCKLVSYITPPRLVISTQDARVSGYCSPTLLS